ncbi:MAG: S8 family peptidase [Thermoleophilia bacterium]
MKTRLLTLFAALLCLAALPATAAALDSPAGGDSGKIDPSVTAVLEATGGDDAIPVLVYIAAGGLEAVRAAVPQAVETTPLSVIDAVAAYLTPSEIAALAASDAVEYIVADNPVFGFDYRSSMDITNLTIGLGDVAAPGDGGPDGDGVTVAVLDSGVATTSDLGSSRIVGWKDFVNKKKLPYDDAGHGTFVAGLIAGDGTASLPLESGGFATMQFRGVAPAADIVGIKVLDASGQGRASAVIAGIVWAIVHKDEYGIRVLNLSIGSNPVGPVEMDPVARAVEAAWKHGIAVVCAAGNEGDFGPGGILSPGNSPYVITVGASDTRQTASLGDDAVAAYSSVGPSLYDEYAKPDLVAPGNRLISLRVPGSYIDENVPENLIPVASYAPAAPAGTVPSYLMLSGSSTSAPVAAGAVALLLGQEPGLTPDDVKLRLLRTADPLAGADVYRQGAGLIDVDGALADEAIADGYTLSTDLGDGTTILDAATYARWDERVWSRYGWTKFKWTKFKWSKFKWTKFKWTDVAWTKFKWTKFKWTDVAWTKFKWTKFKWTDYEWAKFKWTILLEGQ